MNVSVIWPSYHAPTSRHGSWDMGLLEDLFDGKLWNPVRGHQYVHYNTFEEAPEGGAVVVLPGQHHAEDIERLNGDLKRFTWVLMVLVGDEESLFNPSAVEHPNLRWWIQSRRTLLADTAYTKHFLPWGYPQRTREVFSVFLEGQKITPWAFAGQVTHQRRTDCVSVLQRMQGGEVHVSSGFTLGLDRATYYRLLAGCKIAPCPAGAVTPDSFRVWEALEAGCIPIVDAMSPRPDVCPTPHWWNVLLGQDPGFPIVADWGEAPATIEREIAAWPASSNRVIAWWKQYKRQLCYRMRDDINEVSK